jgi:hypothetical protein
MNVLFEISSYQIIVSWCSATNISNNPAYTCTSLRERQHASIKVVCRVTATPVGQNMSVPNILGEFTRNLGVYLPHVVSRVAQPV